MAAHQNSAPNVSQAVPLSPLSEGPSVPTTAPAPSTLMEVLVAATNVILKEQAALNNSLVQTQERVQRLEAAFRPHKDDDLQNAQDRQARLAALEEQRSAHLATHRELVVPPVIGGLEPNRAALQATLGQISGHLACWQQRLS